MKAIEIFYQQTFADVYVKSPCFTKVHKNKIATIIEQVSLGIFTTFLNGNSYYSYHRWKPGFNFERFYQSKTNDVVIFSLYVKTAKQT